MSPDLEGHEAIQSIRRDGFLSEAIARMVPSLRETNGLWYDFALRVNAVGQRLMNAAETACAGRSTHDPVALATRLLIRSVSGYQGAVLLAERGMSVEAETLVRGLYENALWLVYLQADPAEALEALLLDELFSQRSRDRALLNLMDRANPSDTALRASLTRRVEEARDAINKRKPISAEELAIKGGYEDMYPFYKRLSSGSAHASFHSLSKHLGMNPDGSWSAHVTGADVQGAGRALNLAAHALLAGLAAFNAICPGLDGASQVGPLLEEHLLLAHGDREAAP